jgi:multiple sugar transport system substrate-binding protein
VKSWVTAPAVVASAVGGVMMNRKLTRRNFLRVAGTGVAGAALLGTSACGGSDSGSPSGKVTLRWWDYWSEKADKAADVYHQRYMKLNPNVKIERRVVPFDELKKTLLQGAAAGKLPDIVAIDNPDHQSFAALGIIQDISAQVEEWGHADDFFEGPWQSTLWQGGNFGVPDSSDCLTLWYNKDLLEDAKVEPPTNWDELKESAAALTEGNRFGLAVSAIQTEEGTFQWLPFLWQAGADIPNIDSAGGRAALQLWVDMVNEGSMSQGILGWDQQDVANQFMNGQAAMMINGPWEIPVVKEEAPDLNWGHVALPKGKQNASILGGENLAITTACKDVDAAWDLLSWMKSPKIEKSYHVMIGTFPPRKDVANDPYWTDDPVYATYIEQLKLAKPRAYGPKYPEISSAIQEAIQGAVSGESTVEQALSRAQKEITPLLKQ